MRIIPLTFSIATALASSVAACKANDCVDMLGLSPLKIASIGGQTQPHLVVEAFLKDAETIYGEAARIVIRNPKTHSQSMALSRMELLHSDGESFHVKECNFRSLYNSITNEARSNYSNELIYTFVRIEQFDNFVFQAVNGALSCSNANAQFDLKLSRQMLDHAWLEFGGLLNGEIGTQTISMVRKSAKCVSMICQAASASKR